MPSAEELFQRFFLPLYPTRVDLATLRASDANSAKNPSLYAKLDEAAEVFARLAPAELGDASLALDFTDASVHRLSKALTRERRDAWLAEEAGGASKLVTMITHGSLYVGACVVRAHAGEWQMRSPIWESLVRLTSSAGTGDLALFQWWLKALSDDEIDQHRLADRYRTHVEVPTFDANALAPIADPERRLPRLAKVRYDMLYKHLRAHLPELKDVGNDFPSPERFEEMGFKWLDFALLGKGRMLLIHGPTDRGVHLFWLDRSGFVKSAFYAAEAFPAHVVKLDGEKLKVTVSIDGQPRTHEMLWWGV